jgi:hypothetical protein
MEQSIAGEAKEIALKHAKACAIELVEKVAIDALKEAVKKTNTPFDDIAVAALEAPLKQALIDALNKIGA